MADNHADIIEQDFIQTYFKVRPCTMVSVERLYALYKSVRYVVEAGIPGALVECGVWKGGAMMMIAETLAQLGVTDRELYLYDTFAGMTPPSEHDVEFTGKSAQHLLENSDPATSNYWAVSPLEEVQANLRQVNYPQERFSFVQGDVLATIPGRAPEQIALLRLDTDWYDSTLHELQHLFPRLEQNGVLLIDDYGHYLGCRKAVDTYFASLPHKYLLSRVDYSGRVLMKNFAG